MSKESSFALAIMAVHVITLLAVIVMKPVESLLATVILCCYFTAL